MADKNFRVRNGLTIGESIAIDDDGTITGLDTDNLDEGTTNVYYTESRVDANFATKTTDDLTEGTTNKYYASSLFDADLATKTTDDLNEGTTNQYFTDARARQAISVSDTGGDGSLSYNNTTGVVTYTGPSATEVRAHFSGGTGVTITDGSVAIGQSVGTSDSPAFAGVSAGNLTVGVATDNTIASNNTNGDIILDPNGTGLILANAVTRVQGEVLSTTEATYVFPPQTLNTITDNNGYSAASSFPASTNGYGANAAFTHYYGDTLAGTNTAPAFSFRNANGNSVAGMTVPFTGVTSVAPSATNSGNVMGTLNFNGYGTTGFTNDTASANQGGGINALQSVQVQAYPAENFSDSTLTLNSTNVTAVASSFRTALVSPSVTGTRGQISFNTTTAAVGQAIRVTGTLTGTATGIVSGQSYYVIVTNGTTTATLSATPGGSPITTTAGTLTGLTLTRCGVTFTTTGLTNVAFGRGAKVTVSGVTNITDGTYPVWGTPTTTSFALGVPHTVAPTVAGAQSFSCPSTYMGSGFRIRAFPLATPANLQNRLEVVDITPAAAVIRTDSFTIAGGGYGNTGTSYQVITSAKILNNVPHRSAVTTASIARGSTYTPAAGVNNFIELTLTAGTDPTYIDVDNLTVSGEGGHQAILVYNNSGTSVGNGDLRVRNNGTQISDNTGTTIANGARIIFTVYCVGNYASCEYMTAA
jgi:hypothetical protein